MTTVVDMPLDTILAKLREHSDALRREGVAKLFVFGSRARGDARPDSDLDVLVEVSPDARLSLLDLIGVGHIIEDATGLKVQATMRRSIPPAFAERIGDNLVEVF
ncbi:nucleotidyltransferase domain-containing protein [Rhodopseudomonas palustris]|uniref:nucleotidyltransferase family protein n=1 Tax=Rhodopseudomonas palustris TaxID=1076 RepID=UPI002ACDB8E0|nr:nucleotidyltransferase domain-containing protein [Rhodopseudomonas palustris]WQH00099.1 nucleotidyltransferase domain-containing protein [Rhodopseudomonas palustris]